MSVNSSESTANRQIAKAAGTVMFAFVLSNLTSLARQILVANAFGTQTDIEAFNAANRVAETLFNLVAGGALASAFIPTFSVLLAKEEKKKAWRLASAIANIVLLILLIAGILTAIFAPVIVRYILAPGFATDFEKEALTITLLRLMLPSAIIFGLSGLVMAILNSHQVFFIPALAPSMYQLGLIFGVLVLTPHMGIIGLGWGVVIGAGMHLMLQIPWLVRLGGRYVPVLDLDSPDVYEVARLMGPRLLGVAVVQLNFWVNTRLASQFVEGSVTGVILAFTLMLMPQAAIAQSIAIAAMPTFSAQVALGKFSEMAHSLSASLRGALLFSIPASLGLMILREPIIAMLYQRGEFDDRSTELVSWALLWYALGLVGHALVEIVSRAFYSLHDTKTPVFVGIGAMSLNVIFSYLFSWLFAKNSWLPHGGLALANSVATGIEAALLLGFMRRRLGELRGRSIIEGFVQATICAGVMGFILISWQSAIDGESVWLVGVGGVVIGLASFILVAWVIGVREVRNTTKAVFSWYKRWSTSG